VIHPPTETMTLLLGVVPTEVGYAAGWWVALQRGVAAVMIIGVEEGGELCEALGFAGVGARVGPFLFQGAVEPLDLAVGLGPVGAGAVVRDLLAQGGGGGLGPVGGPVVGQHPFDDDPARGEGVIGTVPERGGGLLGLIGVDHAVGQPGVVAQGGGEGLGPVGGPVVGQHPFDDDPARGEVVIGTVPERGGGFLGLIG